MRQTREWQISPELNIKRQCNRMLLLSLQFRCHKHLRCQDSVGKQDLMIYSNACAYAIRALTRLAMVRPDGYVLLDELCDGTDLPRHFVAKIFQDLVRHGLLSSAKGRGGGFALARAPEEITLMDIVRIVDGIGDLEQCVIGMARCDDKQPCPQHDQWKHIRKTLREFLDTTSLEKMSQTTQRKLEIIGQPLPVLKSKSKPLAQE